MVRKRFAPIAWALFIPVDALSIAGWALGITRRLWASSETAGYATYAVRFRSGETFFFHPVIGWWLQNGLWVFFAAFCLLAMAESLSRRRGTGRDDEL